MWVKRSDEELAEFIKRESKSEGRALTAVIALIGLALAISYAFGLVFSRSVVLVEADHSFSGRRFIIGLIAMAVMLLVLRLLFRKSAFDDSYTICPSCSASSQRDADQLCQCGGTLVKLSSMKWVEDQDPPAKA